MSEAIDLSFMEKPEILQRLFPRAFDLSFTGVTQSDSPGADVYFVDVDASNRLTCRFYSRNKNWPSILYFHGGDEIAHGTSTLADHLMENGINFFMTDYRGYGLSDGTPTMSNLLQDCHRLFEYFKQILIKEGFTPAIFVMGRSLGSMPAVETAYHHQKEMRGLIVESGTGQNFKSVWQKAAGQDVLAKMAAAKFFNIDKIKAIAIPTLIIHGEADNLIPVQIGKALYECSGAENKQLIIIPEASHSDLIEKGYEDYFKGIQEFVKACSRKPRAKKPVIARSTSKRTPTTRKSKTIR